MSHSFLIVLSISVAVLIGIVLGWMGRKFIARLEAVEKALEKR